MVLVRSNTPHHRNPQVLNPLTLEDLIDSVNEDRGNLYHFCRLDHYKMQRLDISLQIHYITDVLLELCSVDAKQDQSSEYHFKSKASTTTEAWS